jgi:IS4 transposase
LFRELRSRYKIDEFDTTEKHEVEIIMYAALLTLLVSRELFDLVSEHAADEAVFTSEQ